MPIQGMDPSAMREMMFRRLDTNGDGKLEKSELSSFAAKMSERTGQKISADDLLTRGDANGDGTLSADEMPAPPPRPDRGDASSYQGKGPPNPFARLDADGSGSLSAQELQAMAQRIAEHTGQQVTGEQLLAQLDSDGDGAVSNAEMSSHRRSMQDQVRSMRERFRLQER